MLAKILQSLGTLVLGAIAFIITFCIGFPFFANMADFPVLVNTSVVVGAIVTILSLVFTWIKP